VSTAKFNRGRDSQGQSYYTAPNPPDGALIDYYVASADDPTPVIEILNANGAVVKALVVPPNRGGQRRVVWDLRAGASPDAGRAGGAGRGAGVVAPGTYTARLTLGTRVVTAPVVVKAPQ